MADGDPILDQMAAALAEQNQKTSLRGFLAQYPDWITEQRAKWRGPSQKTFWNTIATVLAAANVVGVHGQPPNAGAVQKAWERHQARRRVHVPVIRSTMGRAESEPAPRHRSPGIGQKVNSDE